MKAWMKIACLGLLIGAYAGGCTITTDDDEDGIGGASVGGTAGTGGAETETGGRTAETGGAAGSGNTETGGAAGSTALTSCEECLYDKCSDEMEACWDEADSNDDGQTDCFREFEVYQTCIKAKAKETPPQEYFDSGVRQDCADDATIYADDGLAPLKTTHDLIACAAPTDPPPAGDCYVECLDFVDAGAGGAPSDGGAGGEGG